MRDEIGVFMETVDQALFKLLGMSGGFMSTELMSTGMLAGVEVVWMNQYLDQRDFGKTINGDLSWAAASLIAVYCYMSFHTKSFFISAFGMANVIFSFILSIFVTKLVFQVRAVAPRCCFDVLHTAIVPLESGLIICGCVRVTKCPATCASCTGWLHGHDARPHHLCHSWNRSGRCFRLR